MGAGAGEVVGSLVCGQPWLVDWEAGLGFELGIAELWLWVGAVTLKLRFPECDIGMMVFQLRAVS